MPLRDSRPQGTLEELKEAGLRPDEYGSCSMPETKTGTNVGCQRYPDCEFRDGPFNLAYRRIRRMPNGTVDERVTTGACYDFLRMRSQDENDDCIVQIVAREGETVECHGSIKQALKPGETVAIHVDGTFPVVVERHKRAKDNYAGTARVAELGRQRRLAKREKQIDKMLMVDDDEVVDLGTPKPLTEEPGGAKKPKPA